MIRRRAWARRYRRPSRPWRSIPADYDTHWRLAAVYLQRRQFDKAEAEYEKARSLNPNHAGFLAEMASALILLGRPAEAVAQIAQAKRINPQYPEWFQANLGWAYYQDGRHEEALAALGQLNDPPGVFRVFLAATFGRLGRIAEAQAEADLVRDLEPGFSLAGLPFKAEGDRARLAEGLARAGLVPQIDA